jgi:MFS family permease
MVRGVSGGSDERGGPAPPGAPGGARLPRAVFALGLTSFFTDVGSEMIFPLLPAFLAGLGASPAFVGLVEGLADATASVLKLVSGRLADRAATKKPLVLVGYGIAAAVRPLVALAAAPWHVLAIRSADRVGKGLRSSPRDALLAALAPPGQAGRAFGLHRAMDHAGAVVGPLVASLLLGLGWSPRRVFLLTIVPGALSVLSVLVVREPPAPAPPAPASAPAKAPGGPLPRPLVTYCAIVTLFCLGNSSDAFLLLRARSAGVELAALPALWTWLHVVKLAGTYAGGGWADRWPRARLIALGWATYSLTYLGFALASRPWQVWGLFTAYGLYYGLSEPAEKALVGELAPAAVRGRAFGTYNFLTGASAVPAGLLTGGLWQAFGPAVALGTGAALAAAASALLLGWARRAPGGGAGRAA